MLTTAEMLQAYRPGSNYRLMVGFEQEVQLFDEHLAPLDYSAMLGVLRQAAELARGVIVEQGVDVVNEVRLPGGRLVSLEPGGQLEFSSAPSTTFTGCIYEAELFRGLVEELTSRCGLHAFYGGVNPVHSVDEIGLVVGKERYRLMDEYFSRCGTMGRRMMRQSCSLQVTFDYQNPELGQDLLRTALFLSPFVAALLSNSPFVDGARTGYRSFRVPIWQNTDPSRSGLPPGFTAEGWGFADYLKQVVDAPMLFMRAADGTLVDAGGRTFAELNRDGYPDSEGGKPRRRATMDDFLLHNSTIFTDVRLKRTVEVRSIDGQDPALVLPTIALLCGLLLCSHARTRTREILGRLSTMTYAVELADRLAREGLESRLSETTLQEIICELVDVAADGLNNCFSDGQIARRYLDPLRELAESGRTPADVVIERFGSAEAWLAAGRTFEALDQKQSRMSKTALAASQPVAAGH